MKSFVTKSASISVQDEFDRWSDLKDVEPLSLSASLQAAGRSFNLAADVMLRFGLSAGGVDLGNRKARRATASRRRAAR